MPDFDLPAYVRTHGLSYDAFLDLWRTRLTASMAGLTPDERRHLIWSRQNWARSEAVHAAFTPSEALVAALSCIAAPQLWFVITEDWCVDGAFSLPVIVEAARRTPAIDLRVILRDTHPEVMDRFLTNGARAMPLLVALGADGDVLFRWGSRSAAGKAHRESLLAEGIDKGEVGRMMVDWQAVGGYETVEPDLVALLEAANAG